MDDVFRVSVVGCWMQVSPFGRGASFPKEASSNMAKFSYLNFLKSGAKVQQKNEATKKVTSQTP